MALHKDPKPWSFERDYDPTGLIKILNNNPDSFTWCGIKYNKDDSSKPGLHKVRTTVTSVVLEPNGSSVTTVEEFS